MTLKPHVLRAIASGNFQTPELYLDEDLRHAVYPDSVTSSVSGYYRIPAVEVHSESMRNNNASQTDIVYQNRISCGINYHVTNDGVFAFDFFDFVEAGPVFLPGYARVDLEGKHLSASTSHVAAVEKFRKVLEYRLRILNVHQFFLSICLNFEWPKELTLDELMHGTKLEGRLSPYSSVHSSRDHTRLLHEIDSEINLVEGRRRDKVTIEQIHRAELYFEKVLSIGDENLLFLVEQIFLSNCQMANGRLGGALVGFWTVIERLVEKSWEKLVADQSLSASRKKLKQIEYTSSVRIETLRLLSVYDETLYENLEHARGARNKWAHMLAFPTLEQVRSAKTSVALLMKLIYDIEINIPDPNQSGYGATWIWADERAMRRFSSKQA